ncbi:hypothetical protein [Haloplanus rallus]|uniref:hypothetical protein n=1 Tax=Haloplanus rallus TaxID=1816183 RepID=UPI0018EE7C64|nr:hypothetical protein [Haloplanus rallus]
MGNVVGTLHGASSLDDEWIEDCETANKEFFRELHGDPDHGFRTMADRLVDALRDERRRAERRAEFLDEGLNADPR